MAATIRDVAKKAGVGVGTVSRVLNESTSVRSETRQRVLDAITDLDFVPNSSARRLSLGKTLTIGVIAPFFTRPSVVERLRGIENILAESEYDLQIFNVETVERRDKAFQKISRREKVDGLIIISIRPEGQNAERLAQTNVPTVLIDAYHNFFSHIILDDVVGGRQATEHLVNLGHKRIAFLSDFLHDPLGSGQHAGRDRFIGYRQALEAANLPFRPDYHVEGIHGRVAAYEMTHLLLNLPEPPTGIFAASDTQALGIMQAAKDAQLNIPNDLSIIGYDDLEIAEYVGLSTIRQPLYESGVEGIQLLLSEIQKPPFTPRSITLPTELVVRNSTMAIG